MAKITSPKNLKQISDNEILQGLSETDTQKTQKAMIFAEKLYGDKSLPMGELIIEHTTGVAKQVATLGLDANSRCAALLSRAISIDSKLADNIISEFGDDTLRLIKGLDKLRRIDLSGYMRFESHNQENTKSRAETKHATVQAESLRKMLLVLSDDIRIIILKLVGRIQSLHYIYKHPSDSARQIAYSSLNYLAPLANRLSIHELKWPIEDWSFRILEPETYQNLASNLKGKRAEREEFIEKILTDINQLLTKANIHAEIKGRAKHLFSIHRKIQKKAIPFSELYDLNATRILVNTIEDCYRVLDATHNQWQFVQAEFDDYIANPKPNGYSSLHTVVIIDNLPVEVQIRTFEMNNLAESGLASHWRYKEGVGNDVNFEKRLSLLRELMDWQKDIAGSDTNLQNLAEDTIYCITPRGDIFDLPQGSTPIDFAYRIHTNIGHRCRGAKVDGKLVPLSTQLKSGQCVDIINVKDGRPSLDWIRDDLHYTKTHRAKAKIRAYFNIIKHEERINEGKSIWLRMQSRLRPAGKPAPSGDEVAHSLSYKSLDEFYLALAKSDVGMHHLKALVRGIDSDNTGSPILVKKVKSHKSKKNISHNLDSDYSDSVTILDLDGLSYQKSSCCKPAPPTAIIGYITRNNIVSVHRVNCKEFRLISNRVPERVVAVAWKKVKKIDDKNITPAIKKELKLIIYGKILNIVNDTKSNPKFPSDNLLGEVMNYAQSNNLPISAMEFNRNEKNTPTINLTLTTNSPTETIVAIGSLPTVNKVEIF